MADVIIREITKNDLFNGFLTSLDSLKQASDLSEQKATEVLETIQSNPNHHILVASLDGKIVGSSTLLIEPKFIHDGGKVGHIEDVVVSKNNQGSRIGEKLIIFALDFAKKQGCYKTILDCSDDVKGFYEKIGFKMHSNGMRFDH